MFRLDIEPRFSDTDALGHISNTVFPVWFEAARAPLFKIFHPSQELHSWPLILARVELDLLAQTFLGKAIEIHSYIGKLGTSSCQVQQEAWQDGKLVAKGLAIMVYFDYANERSMPIPGGIRAQLNEHLKCEHI